MFYCTAAFVALINDYDYWTPTSGKDLRLILRYSFYDAIRSAHFLPVWISYTR